MGSGNSSSNTTSNNTDTVPWSVQQPYIQNAFTQAQNAFDSGPGAYGGNYVAKGTGGQYAQNQYATDWANDVGANAVGNILGTGGNLAGAGTSGATSALNGLNGLGTSDKTVSNIAAATAYANNPAIAGEVKGAMQSGLETAADSALPNLYRNAAATGNINSDRTAIAQGVVQRGLAEQAAGIDASLRGQAYSSGLNAVEQDNSRNVGALSAAGTLGAALGSTGLNTMTQGINDQSVLNSQAQGGQNAIQGLNQSSLNNSLDQYNGSAQYPWQQLQNYYNIVAGKSFGSSSTGSGTSDTQNNPSTLSTIGSIAGMFGSLF